jgi:hypothetical protein
MSRAPALQLLLALLLASAAPAAATTVWTGPMIAFEKVGFTDPTLPANQDAIAPGIALTRASTQGLYNAALETSYSAGAPAGTEWAFPTNNVGLDVSAGNHAALDFAPWAEAVGSMPPASVGQPAVLHLIDLDIYLDITFTSWTGSSGGGAFSYLRATVPEPGTASLFGVGLALWLSGRRYSSSASRSRASRTSSAPSASRR